MKTKKTPWRFRPRRADFQDSAGYHYAVRTGGGPMPHEIDRCGGTGYDAELFRAVWGTEDFGKTVELERRDEQRRRRHAFKVKWRGGRSSKRRKK